MRSYLHVICLPLIISVLTLIGAESLAAEFVEIGINLQVRSLSSDGIYAVGTTTNVESEDERGFLW